ncbi:hypothetical protein GEMRC1_006157 [Eukaryota sp. GEM-RC1]
MVPVLLIDGETQRFWTIGHDLCSVSPPFEADELFFAKELLVTDDHVQTNETYQSGAGECSWFNATSNHLCMNKGYVYAMCRVEDDLEECVEFFHHKRVNKNSPAFNPKHHCPIMQQTAFEAKRISSSGDVMDIAYELDAELAYLHNSTYSAVQNEESWYWKNEDDHCFFKNDSSLDNFDVTALRYSFLFDYVGTKQTQAGKCSLYQFEFWVFKMDLCFNNGVLFQECHHVCHSEPCDYECFDYIDHKEVTAEDKRFDPQELGCDHFDPVEVKPMTELSLLEHIKDLGYHLRELLW